MSMKLALTMGVLATLAFGCSSTKTWKPEAQPKREVASDTCESAYTNATSSASREDVNNAEEICMKAYDDACSEYIKNNSEGAADGRYMSATCELAGAYGANVAIGNGKASKKCEAASKKAGGSPYRGDVMKAIDVCNKEKESLCSDRVNSDSDGIETGDGKYVLAFCNLTGAHGAYSAVKALNSK